ncbi:hypothetical protein HID58_029076, partial [Brassica napus]
KETWYWASFLGYLTPKLESLICDDFSRETTAPRANINYLIQKRTNPISLPVSLLMSKKGYRTRELEAANFTHRGMSCIRYGEGGKGMADGGCSVSSIEGVHDSYIVVISGRWIMYDIGDWDFKLDSDRMGRAVYAKLITSVEALKRAILESYGLVGTSVAVEMSYWLREHGSCAVGEREAPVQISNDKDFDLFTSARKVDKYINVFVTFKEEVDGKILYMRPMENLLKSKEVASSNEMQVGSTSADVHTRNEVNDGETDLTEDEIILMGVAEIEAVYASNGFGMREVDGTTCEVQNKVDTAEDAALGEGEDDDDEDYDYNLWHDFVGRNCEWDDDKDDDGGVGGGCRTNVTYGGVRGEVMTKMRSGRTNPSSNKGSGPSTNKQHTANPPSTFKDYVDEGRDYIGSSRISMENIEEASNNLGVKSSDQVADTENHSDPNQEEDPSLDNNSQMLVLQTPPKPFNMHTREVDDSDDFVGQVPQCVSSRPTHDTSDGVYEDDDFVEPVPMCVSGGQTHETPDGEDEDDDFVEPVPQCVSGGQTHETLVREDEDNNFIEPVPQSRSREEDARRRREKDKTDDESIMKSVRAVELYGFEDVESSSNNEAVNDYTVDDIDFTLADADMYTGKLFSSKQEFKISLHIYALKQLRTLSEQTENPDFAEIFRMARVVMLVQGLWTKSAAGDWTFEEDSGFRGDTIMITGTDSFEGLVEMIRIRLCLGILTPVALTYQLPEWMRLPEALRTPPINLTCDKDVEILASVREYMTEPVVYVTSGPEPVAKYQFLCRYPFTIGEKTYLEEGVTEEQHRQAIRDLVGAHTIVCSKHLLEIMFNEPQLLVVFRVALEIEMVYSIPGEDDDPPVNYHRLTVDDIIEMQPGFPLSPDDPANYGADDEVLYGKPMTIEEYDRAFQTHQGPPPGGLPSLPPVWEETNEMSGDELTYEVYVHPTPPPVNGTVGHPIGPNRRVSALPPPTLIIIADNDNESYTGSSDGINENENIITLSPTSPLAPIIPDATNNRANVGNRGTPAESYMATPPPAADVEAIATDISNTKFQGKMTVAKYKRFFYSLPIVGERTEQQLIELAKAGLKEEIREGLETDEFATLEALFEEAEEVEEGLKETPPSTPRKRRRRSPNPRSSKRARKAEEKGDPEDDGYGYDGEGASEFKDDEEGEYWDWMQMETDVNDDASDRTDDTLGNQTIGYDNLYQGKVFNSRDDFKHHMALYVLRHKFRFRHTRCSPNRMVLCCVSLKCMWRVHAIKLKNVENFEIRRVQLQHTCSIDERAAGDIELNVEEQCGNVTIFPPVTRRPPGKPRKNRILSTGEIRMKTPRKRHLCGRCKKSGHSRATCKVAI